MCIGEVEFKEFGFFKMDNDEVLIVVMVKVLKLIECFVVIIGKGVCFGRFFESVKDIF